MPTYEYSCEKCGHQFDIFQSIKDPALKVCPEEKCAQKKWGKGKVKRGISAGAGLIFKGSGFYITDYRSENYKAQAKQEAGGGEAKTGGAEAKSGGSESKGAEKAAPSGGEKKAPRSPKPESKPGKTGGKEK
jgi:putative FmdB family regulatory protein